MSSKNTKYTREIVNLYHSGKTYSEIHKEYGVSHNALPCDSCQPEHILQISSS